MVLQYNNMFFKHIKYCDNLQDYKLQSWYDCKQQFKTTWFIAMHVHKH